MVSFGIWTYLIFAIFKERTGLKWYMQCMNNKLVMPFQANQEIIITFTQAEISFFIFAFIKMGEKQICLFHKMLKYGSKVWSYFLSSGCPYR